MEKYVDYMRFVNNEGVTYPQWVEMTRVAIPKVRTSVQAQNSLLVEHYQWIEENCDDLWTRNSRNRNQHIYYFFKNARDALAFKLRWG